jgi:hypothetical protein
MEEITIKYNPIQTLGYISCDVPADVFTEVNNEIKDMIDTSFKTAVPHNNKLAGYLEREYSLLKSVNILNKFFKKVIPEYWKLQGDCDEAKKTYQILTFEDGIPSVWVNLQQKYEYNPLHDHTGVLSFVMYVQIPYKIEQELDLPFLKHCNSKKPPELTFMYPGLKNVGGNYRPVETFSLYITKDWVGTMIIFPAWLQHQVTPFYTSDEYRISVAGNLVPVNNG